MIPASQGYGAIEWDYENPGGHQEPLGALVDAAEAQVAARLVG